MTEPEAIGPDPALPDPALPQGVPASALAGFSRLPGTLWWVLGSDGTVLRCGPTVQDVLGWEPDGLIGRPVAALVDPGDAALWRAAFDRALAGSEVTGVVAGVAYGGGGSRRIGWTLRRGADNATVVAFGRDQSGSWCSAAWSGGSEGRLVESLLQAMPLPVFVKGLDGRYRFVNRAFCRLAGLDSPTDVVGRRATDIWPELDPDFAANEAEVYRRATHQTIEHSILGVGPRTLVVVRQVVFDEQGNAQAMVGLGTDITEQVAAERQTADRNAALQAVLAGSDDLITVVDHHRQLLYANARSEAVGGIAGWCPAVAGFADVVHPDDRSTVVSAFDGVWDRGTPVTVRYRVRQPGGGWKTVDSCVQVVRGETGDPRRMVVVTTDVTDLLAAEAQVRAAVVAAERAGRAKTDLLSRVSHELRTPLNALLAFAQLLQLDDLPDEEAAAVDAVVEAGRNLLGIVDDILDLARLDAGQLPNRPEPLAWAEVTAATRTARLAGLRVLPDPAAPSLLVDPRWFELVLVQLAEVVRGASGIGPTHPVVLVAEPERPDPGWVRLSIEPEPQATAHPAAEPVESVGLARCRSLIEQMGGRLTVEPGDAGIRIDVDLPTTEGDRPAAIGDAPGTVGSPARPSRVDASESLTGAVVVPLDVLVVTDDRAVEDLVRQVALRRPGTEVRCTSWAAQGPGRGARPRSGGEAQGHVDLVLLDEAGAGGDADVLWLVVRRSVATDVPSRPVVAVLAAASGVGSAGVFLDRGVDAYLGAPLDVRALLRLVDSVRELAFRPRSSADP